MSVNVSLGLRSDKLLFKAERQMISISGLRFLLVGAEPGSGGADPQIPLRMLVICNNRGIWFPLT
jgi:hypothetical protein